LHGAAPRRTARPGRLRLQELAPVRRMIFTVDDYAM